MCSSLQEREAGVRASRLFSGDNWFWNRLEMRAGRRGWWRAAAGSKPISAGLVPLITAVLAHGMRPLSHPGKLKPFAQPTLPHPPSPTGLMNFSWIGLSLSFLPWSATVAGGSAVAAFSHALLKLPSWPLMRKKLDRHGWIKDRLCC